MVKWTGNASDFILIPIFVSAELYSFKPTQKKTKFSKNEPGLYTPPETILTSL